MISTAMSLSLWTVPEHPPPPSVHAIPTLQGLLKSVPPPETLGTVPAPVASPEHHTLPAVATRLPHRLASLTSQH